MQKFSVPPYLNGCIRKRISSNLMSSGFYVMLFDLSIFFHVICIRHLRQPQAIIFVQMLFICKNKTLILLCQRSQWVTSLLKIRFNYIYNLWRNLVYFLIMNDLARNSYLHDSNIFV